MNSSKLNRAIRTLRFKADYRRALASATMAWGIIMALVGAGMLRSVSSSIEEIARASSDDPSAVLLLALISMIALTAIIVGIVAVTSGTLRLFTPDPKITVLLELLDRNTQNQEHDKLDET